MLLAEHAQVLISLLCLHLSLVIEVLLVILIELLAVDIRHVVLAI